MKTFYSASPEDTELIAENLAQKLTAGCVIAFTGDLGAGKTCFTRGLGRGLGFKGEINSPTFSLINEYLGGRLPIFHFDMYRISSWEDLYSSGFFEYCEAGGVVVVEWSENITAALGESTIFADIKAIGDMQREITISGGGF